MSFGGINGLGSTGPGDMINLTYAMKTAGESRKTTRLFLITCGVFLAVGAVMFLVFGFLIR